jgi:hypothetical protein
MKESQYLLSRLIWRVSQIGGTVTATYSTRSTRNILFIRCHSKVSPIIRRASPKNNKENFGSIIRCSAKSGQVEDAAAPPWYNLKHTSLTDSRARQQTKRRTKDSSCSINLKFRRKRSSLWFRGHYPATSKPTTWRTSWSTRSRSTSLTSFLILE